MLNFNSLYALYDSFVHNPDFTLQKKYEKIRETLFT